MQIDDVLSQRFGLAAFPPWQREAIEALVGDPGRVLVVAPTGGGKSLTYQLPAAMLGATGEGTTLVLSPLVALMEDQVRALEARGIRATFLASTLELDERRRREAAMVEGAYEIVYCAPERLAAEAFVSVLTRTKIALVAIDEAHCIAQWGHDFRPDYLRIGSLLERLSPRRVLACTATATPEVRAEIGHALGFREGHYREVLRGFARPNLHLSARAIEGPKEGRASLVAELGRALGSPKTPNGAAIVYAATRKTTEQTAEWLSKQGWDARAYHAGMAAAERTKVANGFADRSLSVVVATNAFGMGIDRPDIRTVVHVQPPSSIEAYYQEVGRAGRDGAEASGLLLCSGSDIALRRRLVTTGADGGAADPEAVLRAWSLFRELLRYLDARTCRHDFVLRYFGDEQETLGGCGHCDVCVALEDEDDDAASREAAVIAVKMALSAVARANKRAGLGAIGDMLRGIDNERTRKFGFTHLSTFGLMKERSEAWIAALLRAVLAAGWIDLTTSEHPVPYLTKPGAAAMKGVTPIRLVLPPEPQARSRRSGSKSKAPTEVPASDRDLFERLRAHRAEVARGKSVPAYVVASDKTLAAMAQKRPRTRIEMLDVYGMGPARVDQYGEGFLAVLAADR